MTDPDQHETSNPYDAPTPARMQPVGRSKAPWWAVIAVATPTFIVLFCSVNLLATLVSTNLSRNGWAEATGVGMVLGLIVSILIASFAAIGVTKLFTRRKFPSAMSGKSASDQATKLSLQKAMDDFHAQDP